MLVRINTEAGLCESIPEAPGSRARSASTFLTTVVRRQSLDFDRSRARRKHRAPRSANK